MGLIVLTTDLSPESRRAFAPAMELAKQLGHDVTLLHVVVDVRIAPHGSPLAPQQSSPELDAEIDAANEQLAEMAFELGGGAGFTVVTGENVAQAVVDYANAHRADFIALSTHGRTGIRHLVLGSVAEQVIRRARVPVVSYPMKQD